ncbi:hypothetical protein BBJ28_00014664 [Nothophytophthora sp. Chile5]|nr:hypothetical protein BBJ28_00014664 [Nothophytophthora sp. Chile5]
MESSASVATAGDASASANGSTSGADAVAAMCQDSRHPAVEGALVPPADKSSAPTVPLEASVVSDATMNSSDRSSSCSSSDSSADALDDDYGARDLSTDEDDEGDEEDAQPNRFLLKPMPTRLQVCPVDDLAVEDEKRRRRSRRSSVKTNAGKPTGKKAAVKGVSRDAESLPSTPSPLMARTRRSGSTPALSSLDSSSSSSSSTAADSNRPSSAGSSSSSTRTTVSAPLAAAAVGPKNDTLLPPAVPMLRKDSAAIRRQYWSQLGFSLSRSDLEKSTGRKKERREGLKVRLNDADRKQRDAAKGFFQFITSWYAPVTAASDENKAAASRKDKSRSSARQMRSSLSRTSASSSDAAGSSAPVRRGVRFNEEAELFYIPLHRDYSKRQRDCMWPTRTEFVTMVERNLDAVYDEMEREYEAQLENEYLENEGMAREEARQRAVDADRKAARTAAAAAAAAQAQAQAAATQRSVSPAPSRTMSAMSSVPSLTLNQSQVLVAPRARSSHDIRFKYLKHLGINS